MALAFMMTLLFIRAQGSLPPRLESLSIFSPSIAGFTAKMKLVNDIVAKRQEENIVTIADSNDIGDFSNLDKGLAYVTMIEPRKVTKQMMADLKVLHLKDNTACFYIILPTAADTDEDVKALVLIIPTCPFTV